MPSASIPSGAWSTRHRPAAVWVEASALSDTDRQVLDQTLARLEAQHQNQRRMRRQRDRWLALLSHDLRAPQSNILSLLERRQKGSMAWATSLSMAACARRSSASCA